MCTMISITKPIRGMGKGTRGWFPLTRATVGYDHSSHSADAHALLIDLVNYELGTDARIAVELDIEAGKVLVEQLQYAIAQAEQSGVAIYHEGHGATERRELSAL
jgi:hypothetical protein